MKAVVWHGKHDVRVDEVPDPKIVNPRDAILKITTTAICGSDLHLYDGVILTMQRGDVLGHEFMGEVVEVGKDSNLQKGDRVIVPFNIACGNCHHCKKQLFSACDNTNPNAAVSEKIYGYPAAGMYGYSHLFGGYNGGQAEYVRVPYSDVNPLKIPEGMTDEQVLFLTDIFPTGYMAADNCEIEPGDTVAIWGAGPVGQVAVRSAYLLGAKNVISIDNIPDRLEMARQGGAQTLNFDTVNVLQELKEMTGGRGPDSCIDAVGMEAHGTDLGNVYDYTKQALRMSVDRPNVLRQMILACGKGGTLSIPGVYAGMIDKLPFGIAFGKGLTWKMGQTHVQRYLPRLLQHIQDGDIDPTFIITHRLSLKDAPQAYETFKHKKDNCIKVVMTP
jgi:threonine dehydrogenase-like Zn-dependent dehydrogenase